MEEKVQFLKNYLFKELVIVEGNYNLLDFIKASEIQTYSIVCEKEIPSKGDYVIFKQNYEIIHIVKPNETLAYIATKYCTTEEKIRKDNNITKLFIGKQLKILR